MPNVHNIIGVFEKLESRDITVHQHRCVRVRNRNTTCSKCADACTSGCISFAENELVIQPEKCIGCGTCCTVCPTCALEANRPNDAELFRLSMAAMQKADGEVVLASEQILAAAEGLYDPERVVSLVNLGRIEETLLVRLAEAGAKRITLVQPREVDAANAKGIETAQLVCDTANLILQTWGSDCRARVAEKFPSVARRGEEAAYNEARRSFFTDMRDEATEAAGIAANVVVDDALGVEPEKENIYQHLRVMDDGTLPHFMPDRRERLLNALSDLGEPEDVMLNTRLWGHVVIDVDKCTGCRMCATFCPTGAIFKYTDEDDGTTGIEHAPGDCVKCYSCQDVCPAGALELSEEVFAVDLLSGAVDRYEMEPEETQRSDPHSIVNSMKGLIGISQIYER